VSDSIVYDHQFLLVIIARFSAMKPVAGREIVVTKLGQKIAWVLHFGGDPSKDFPVHGMKCALVSFETVLVVCNEGGKAGLCA
jgi:hypothetical protein